MTTVHPHVHGELSELGYDSSTVSGSSPRAWGTHQAQEPSRYLFRFIPTCMGNSLCYRERLRTWRVHPHVHGELLGQYIGKQNKFGFIPTCMGNSLSRRAGVVSRTVHPHVHGELPRAGKEPVTRDGSSPRAWGTRPGPQRGPPDDRFIPTCMGNSRTSEGSSVLTPVHPHVHGELIAPVTSTSPGTGSSPRAWGTPRRRVGGDQLRRFIPTCMGNSPRQACSSGSTAVHPHVHGELTTHVSVNLMRLGSSPRALATPRPLDGPPGHVRFIPTCMGNS